MTIHQRLQYSYTVVETAALWVGIDPGEVKRRMDSTDMEAAEAIHRQAIDQASLYDFDALVTWHEMRDTCSQCEKPLDCPEWKYAYFQAESITYRRLQCPHGFLSPPDPTAPLARPTPEIKKPASRLLPLPGEFADLPEFEKR